ncbi:substrate-binding domain-containing protein [uncultured Sphaerochaeta sp.]|uniref:substrate-binding domain-containing protein n=1 Tax=uncultured Sphaerochaeta sp. TaxID=886478 RepID=UPI002A0A28DD|nr:substrate-binding domain-containing protein [uncultured Sphaerochaeta sp.]
MKRTFSRYLIILVISLLLFSSCEKRNEKDNPYRIAVITMMQGGEFWGEVKNGARNARTKTDTVLEFLAPVNESDYEGQIACVEKAIEEKFDAIVLSPSHSINLEEVVRKARSKGIEVVLADSSLATETADFSITADYKKIGKEMAYHAFSLFAKDESINAMVLGSLPDSTPMTNMMQGLVEVFNTNDKATIRYATYSFSDESRAKDITQKTISEDTSVNLVFALEENTAHGAADAIKGKEGIHFIAFGTTQYEIQLLENNGLDALVVVNAFNMGYRSVQAAVDLLNGRKPVEKTVDFALVTKKTMFNEEYQRLLFQSLN